MKPEPSPETKPVKAKAGAAEMPAEIRAAKESCNSSTDEVTLSESCHKFAEWAQRRGDTKLVVMYERYACEYGGNLASCKRASTLEFEAGNKLAVLHIAEIACAKGGTDFCDLLKKAGRMPAGDDQ